MASDVGKLPAKWRAEAAQLRAQASRAQKRGDGTDLELFQSAQDAERYADELEAALTQPAASGEVVAWRARGMSDAWVYADKRVEHFIKSPWEPLYTPPQPDADTVRLADLRNLAQDVRNCFGWRVSPDRKGNHTVDHDACVSADTLATQVIAAIDSAIKGEKS